MAKENEKEQFTRKLYEKETKPDIKVVPYGESAQGQPSEEEKVLFSKGLWDKTTVPQITPIPYGENAPEHIVSQEEVEAAIETISKAQAMWLGDLKKPIELDVPAEPTDRVAVKDLLKGNIPPSERVYSTPLMKELAEKQMKFWGLNDVQIAKFYDTVTEQRDRILAKEVALGAVMPADHQYTAPFFKNQRDARAKE